MRTRLHWLALLVALPACGGGGGGGDTGVPPPPGPPFAITVNTGLAVKPAFDNIGVVGRTLLVPVSERDMFEDRNGDGDTVDNVLATVDTDAETTVNIGLAVIGPVLNTMFTYAFLVSEGGNGGTDLNGDGDIGDAVWHVYDPAQPIGVNNPVNTGVATLGTGLAGIATEGGYVFLESEAAQGTDRNGDGDLGDNVVAVYDEAVQSAVPVAVATHMPTTKLVARNGRVLVATSETLSGADLNRDGDAFDIVLAYVDFNLSVPILRPVGGLFPRAVGLNPYELTDTAAVYMIEEATEGGIDLNGDGDSADAIMAVFDIAGGTGEFLPFSTQLPAPAMAGAPTIGIGTSGSRAVFALLEAANNATDLNGDLDAFDRVVAWIDPAAPGSMHIQPATVAPLPIRVSGTRALFAVSEKDSSAIVGVDHNGDGDISDNVAFVLDMPAPRGAIFNLGFAVTTLDLRDNDALIGVPEVGHFGGDLNGNGVVGDVVTIYFDVGDSPPTVRSLGIVANATSHFRLSTVEVRLAALMPEGQSGSFDDLNGDGDNKDTGIVLLGIDPSGTPPPLLPPTPFFAGTGGFNVAAPLRVGNNAFAFASAEDMLRIDFNGDGDTLDTVLHFVRYELPGQ